MRGAIVGACKRKPGSGIACTKRIGKSTDKVGKRAFGRDIVENVFARVRCQKLREQCAFAEADRRVEHAHGRFRGDAQPFD